MAGNVSTGTWTTLIAASFAAAGAALYYVYSLSNNNDNNNSQQQENEKKKKKKRAIPTALLTSPYGPHIQLAVQLALQAGDNMFDHCNEKGTVVEDDDEHDESRRGRRRQLVLKYKGQPEDFCTHVDIENETLIACGIQNQFPTHFIIGEESTGNGTIPSLSSDTLTWIIDPIDGTINFAAGLPLTCVSIGLCNEQGKPVMGVVYAPMTDELFLAVAGHGAYRNGVQLARRRRDDNYDSTTTITTPTITTLSEATVGFEFGYARKPEAIAAMVAVPQRILLHGCRSLRQLGSGVLDLCYVAMGRLDAVYSGVAGEGWKPWDYCAGAVLVHETGCLLESFDTVEQPLLSTMTTTTTSSFDLYSTNLICATNRILLEEIRTIVKDVWIRE